jgi:hypothetical protein
MTFSRMYAKELRPYAQRMLYELPPSWAQEQPQRDPLSQMQQDYGYQATLHDDEQEYEYPPPKPRSPSYQQRNRQNEGSSELQRSPRAERRNNTSEDNSHSLSLRTSSKNDGPAVERPPLYGYDAEDRPYYSVVSQNIKETYGIFIGKNGMCIRPVERHFKLSFRIHKYEDLDYAVLWVEQTGKAKQLREIVRKRLRLAWGFLQAWADQVELGRKKRAEDHESGFYIPTVAEFLERWEVFEETKQWPAVSKQVSEPPMPEQDMDDV